MSRVSQTLDRIHATFDHDGLISNAGLIVPVTLMIRLGLAGLVARFVNTGSFLPARKVCFQRESLASS